MGTNYYWITLPKELEDGIANKEILLHIGKRSAAGNYCKKCGTTFHKFGTNEIHGQYNPHPTLEALKGEKDALIEYEVEYNSYWYRQCPICGGYGTYICSFTWTFMKQKEIIKSLVGVEKPVIRDEYGDIYSAREFLERVKTPVEYQCAGGFV